MATLKNTTVNDTGFLTLPSGTTAQRPGSPSAGMLRYNTTIGTLEQYNSTGWESIGGNVPVITTVTGTAYATISTTLTITGNYFGLNAVTVRFGFGATVSDVSATPSSSTSISVAVPAAIYNLAVGTSGNVSVIDSTGKQSNGYIISVTALPGTSSASASSTSTAIKTANPNATTGWYWLNLDGTPRQYWIDMDYSGGGWVMVMSHYSGVAINNNLTFSQTTTNNSYIGSSTLTSSVSNPYSYSFILGLNGWNTIVTNNNVGRNFMYYTAASQVGPNSASRRTRWTWTGWSGTYQWNGVAGVTNEVGGVTPGLYTYHIANNGVWSTFDGGNTGCCTQYNNAPWWYVGCWDGSFWGGNGGGGYANAPFWTGSGSDYYTYGAMYVK